MIKKTLLALSVMVTASQALTLDFTKKGLYAETGKKIIYTSTDNTNPKKDWMGIYKKGDSTNWNNVIDWKWVKDLPCHNPSPCHDVYKMPDLGQGDYVIRYFQNNSYTTFAAKDFKVSADVANSINLKNIERPTYGATSKILSVHINGNHNTHFTPNSKDWVGIYKVSDSNAWSNVKKWAWAKDFKKALSFSSYYNFKNVSLPTGKYEARYFLNNGFRTFKTSKSFEIKDSNQNTKPYKINANYDESQNKLEITVQDNPNGTFKAGRNDIIGIYKVGASNSHMNIIIGVDASELKRNVRLFRYTFPQSIRDMLPPGKYEARYLLNRDETTAYKKSIPFEIKSNSTLKDKDILALAKKNCLGEKKHTIRVLCREEGAFVLSFNKAIKASIVRMKSYWVSEVSFKHNSVTNFDTHESIFYDDPGMVSEIYLGNVENKPSYYSIIESAQVGDGYGTEWVYNRNTLINTHNWHNQ